MRVESSVTSVSWIPSEAVTGRGAQGHVRVRHHELRRTTPRPSSTTSTRWRAAGSVPLRQPAAARGPRSSTGRIVDSGCTGGGLMGATTVRLAKLRATFQPVLLPDLRPDPTLATPRSRSSRPPAGAPAFPRPRRVKHPPFLQFRAPTVWTTLALTIRADGTSSFEVLGASKFPRHWVYDARRADRGQGRARQLQGVVPRTRSASTRRGATRTRRRSSPRSRPRSNASSRSRSCRGGERPEIRTLKEGEYLVAAGRSRRLAVPPARRRAVGHDGRRGRRRGRTRRRARRAGRARGRDPHRQPPGGHAGAGGGRARPTGSTARRCSQLREHHTPKAK